MRPDTRRPNVFAGPHVDRLKLANADAEFVARALDANLGPSADDLDLDTLHWRLHAALSDPALRARPAMVQLAREHFMKPSIWP